MQTTESNEVRLKLTIDVQYELGSTDTQDLKQTLIAAADHLASQGLLSGSTEASVLAWDATVEELNITQ